METPQEQPLGLTLDIKKRRIRIHTSTIHAIGDPEYFRFLVNPEKKNMIIESCDERTRGAFRLKSASFHHNSLELYSKDLMDRIVACAEITSPVSIRLYGKLMEGETKGVFFRIDPRGGNQAEQQDGGRNG